MAGFVYQLLPESHIALHLPYTLVYTITALHLPYTPGYTITAHHIEQSEHTNTPWREEKGKGCTRPPCTLEGMCSLSLSLSPPLSVCLSGECKWSVIDMSMSSEHNGFFSILGCDGQGR